ncbi:MAG: YitT family protein [Clostridiales bacterium]|nr:YitT family protein [Clostridiales bacterium]
MDELQENIAQTEETATSVLPKKITREDLKKEATTRRGKIFYWTQTVFILLLSSFLVSFAAYSLILPNEFTIGGISGIAILLDEAFHIPQYIIVFSVNMPLVIFSFFFVKKKFAILTAAHIGLQTAWLALIELAFPHFQIDFGNGAEKIFAAIAGGLCIGVAVALAFKIGGSTGGADILAVVIQRKFNAGSIARVIFLINCIVIASSIFVFKPEEGVDNSLNKYALTLLPIMMSVFESYIESKANEAITSGFHSAIEYRIITNKPDEMSFVLMKELNRGVTSVPATGMYTKEPRAMLLCVVSRRQVTTLKRIVKEIDPESFAFTTKVSQVLGLGFYSDELSA